MRFDLARNQALGPDAVLRQIGNGWRRLLEWRRQRLGVKGLLLYVLVIPLALATVIHALSGNLLQMLLGIGASALLLMAARLNRLALLEELLRRQRRFSTPRKKPFRLLRLLAFAGFAGITAWGLAGHGVAMAGVYASLAALGMSLSYPLSTSAPGRNVSLRESLGDTARSSLEQAEERLLNLRKLGSSIGQPELDARLAAIADTGERILERLAEKPALLPGSRRFLHVHLEGAERVAKEYAKTHRLLRKGRLETRFRETLLLIDKAFHDHQREIERQQVETLDIQIAVLKEQLRNHSIQ
jgi:hypothetical protein